MRKLVVSEFISLDGVMEEPGWTSPYWNDEIARFKQGELFSSGTLLLGRVTYEGFAAAWPGREDEEGYADRMNSMPKYVVSTTLKKATWNNSTLIQKDVVTRIAALKEGLGPNILVFGSATLVKTLVEHDLVDRYNLLVYPVVLGKGRRLFEAGSQASLKLEETHAFGSGVVAMVYAPAREKM